MDFFNIELSTSLVALTPKGQMICDYMDKVHAAEAQGKYRKAARIFGRMQKRMLQYDIDNGSK